MRRALLEASDAVASERPEAVAAIRRPARWLRATVLACLLIGVPLVSHAAPFLWDEDGDRVDDRIETIHLLGYSFAFETPGDTLSRMRIQVANAAGGLAYSVYVVYDHTPTNDDRTALTVLGMPILFQYEAVPAIRSVASFAQVQAVASFPGVERVEAVPVLYPMLHDAAAAMGARDASAHAFPTWYGSGGADGSGIVIAFLDTGINDAPDGGYPGHESLLSRCLGGATFLTGDANLDTPKNGSVNPVDRGGAATQSHGTHVASIALGTGGSSGYASGIAPGARFVDIKALNDAGTGTGVAEALDWCIANRARNWGVAGYEGIDVINLSLSSVDEADGNDVASRLADQAVQLGMVVVASVGNDGQSGHVPSPAAGDHVLAVGAYDHAHTPELWDDSFASFDNYGPRASDGDASSADEQKPDLLAPGVSVLAANGDLSTDGSQYRRLSGTSMSAAFVSGAVAALLSEFPTMTPAAIGDLLKATAFRQLSGVPAGQTGPDPRWRSTIGWGAIDLYAARLEQVQPGRSQVARLELRTVTPDQVQATLRTQRETGAAWFTFERAPDQGGAPGAFAAYDSVSAAGDPSLLDANNRATYLRTWSVPNGELGSAFWYRVAYTEAAVRYETAARRLVSPVGPPVATIEATIVHNAYDSDVTAQVLVGSANEAMATQTSSWTFPLPGTASAASSDWVTGLSATGNVAWTFSIDVPQGTGIESFLPPRADKPWRLQVAEAGFLNRSGRVTDFRVIWHKPSGTDEVYPGAPVPRQTLEGSTVYVLSPAGATDVPLAGNGLDLRVGPNPIVGGQRVRFFSRTQPAGPVRIHDLAGREIAHLDLARSGDGFTAVWEARDQAGRALAPGLYFARAGREAMARLVLLQP